MNKHNLDKPRISIIVAVAVKNRAIGKDNGLLWHIPADLKRFKEVTSGHPVIMGQNTWESLPEKFRPLPNRKNIVLTKDSSYVVIGAELATSIQNAIDIASSFDDEEIFFIGGASVYKQALPLADKLYITLVEGDFEGDTFFPDYSEFKNETYRESGYTENIKYTFLELQK